MPQRDIATDSGVIDSDSLCTPSLILDPLYELYEGMVDTDPCSNQHSIVRARQAYTTGGLVVPWSYKGQAAKTWENQPYSVNQPWADKTVYEMRMGNIAELVVLCMAATSTYWWMTFAQKTRVNPRIIFTQRLRFMGPDGRLMKDTARFDTALMYYPRRRSQYAKFDRLYKHVARWTTWGR